jgi:ethanolamine kinase
MALKLNDFYIRHPKNHENLTQILLQLRSHWSEEKIRIEQIKGGTTNSLFACFQNETGLDSTETILVRLYGPGTDLFISRDEEVQTMLFMSKINLGAKFFGRFQNGICFEYLPGVTVEYETILTNERVYTKVAKAMAQMHSIKYARYEEFTDSGQKPFIFEKIKDLLSIAQRNNNKNNTNDSLLDKLKYETKFLENYLTSYAKSNDSFIVFSHNDLSLTNMIYNQVADSIKFIDFEYASMNYQAFDVGNFFCEYAGIEVRDYTRFPRRDYQLKWIEIYLKEFYNILNDSCLIADEVKVLEFYREVNKFSMASHLLWSVWNLVQAGVSELEYDFMKAARVRFDEYCQNKQEIINL